MVKNTKNICRVLFFSGMLLVTSACSDSFLQTDSPNQPSQTTYWQTESDALMAGSLDFWDVKPVRTMETTHGVTGCWEVLFRNVRLLLLMNVSLCIGMPIMR